MQNLHDFYANCIPHYCWQCDIQLGIGGRNCVFVQELNLCMWVCTLCAAQWWQGESVAVTQIVLEGTRNGKPMQYPATFYRLWTIGK